MTFTTLFAAVASMGVAAMTTDIGASAHAFSKFSVAVPVAASLVSRQLDNKANLRGLAQSQSSARLKPLQPQGDEELSLGDALKMQRGGFIFSLTAFKPKSFKDPTTVKGMRLTPSYRRQSRAMGKAMPGYPQPPKAVVAVKVAF